MDNSEGAGETNGGGEGETPRQKRIRQLKEELFKNEASGDEVPPVPPHREWHENGSGLRCPSERPTGAPHDAVGFYRTRGGTCQWYYGCAKCRDKQRKCQTDLRTQRNDQGLCQQCGVNPPSEGCVVCRKCLDEAVDRYEERTKNGICLKCPGNALEGHKVCGVCLESTNNEKKAYQATPAGQAVQQKARDTRKEKVANDLGLKEQEELTTAASKVLAGRDEPRHRERVAEASGMTAHEFRNFLVARARIAYGDDSITLQRDYGIGNGLGLTLDHIIPQSEYDYTEDAEVKRCCHYSNIQLLSKPHNSSKGASLHWRYIKDVDESCYPKAWRGVCPVSEPNPVIVRRSKKPGKRPMPAPTTGASDGKRPAPSPPGTSDSHARLPPPGNE